MEGLGRYVQLLLASNAFKMMWGTALNNQNHGAPVIDKNYNGRSTQFAAFGLLRSFDNGKLGGVLLVNVRRHSAPVF